MRNWIISFIAEASDEDLPGEGFVTCRFFAPPRPPELRRGCLVMREAFERVEPGSLIFRRDAKLPAKWPKDFGRAVSYWHWDGKYPNGYYFDDLTRSDNLHHWIADELVADNPLPEDARFGHRWVSQDNDVLHYRIWARNLTFESLDFVLWVRLYRGESPEDLEGRVITLNFKGVHTKGRLSKALGYNDGFIQGALDISGLSPDIYTVRFDLYQDDLLQETKFITFCTTR